MTTDSKSPLSQFIEENKEVAYKLASVNTPCNASGHPVITKDDEWCDETEWDEVFADLQNEKKKKLVTE